ncbi:hypothetical protein ACV30B_02400 [Clostridium perfringens]|nr:hypothetical protein [Clostridium perfringens]MDJ9055277.1 hypothetical protein [Clostridium perfringens]MDJ9062608.1 hypothetical protein [Clostridium perfringens]HAT4310216.1 hypothetical protein [Clostridium perfringens]HBI6921893.1 hypothetical protein [Clostridium perfringens]
MKQNKSVVSLVIILSLIALLGVGFWYNIFNSNDLSYIDKYTIIGNVSQIFTVLLTLVNLFFILYFFYFENKNKIEENKIISKANWFNDFIYERNIGKFENFFENLKSIAIGIDENISEEKMKKTFDEVNELFFIIYDNFISLVEIIDEELFSELSSMLYDFQDEFTEKLQQLDIAAVEWNETVGRYRKQIIKRIYDYNINIYNK